MPQSNWRRQATGSNRPPLLRSALEHGMRLYRAGAGESGLLEVALLSKKETSFRLIAAQHEGFMLDEETIERLETYAKSDTIDFDSLAHLKALKHAVDNSPAEAQSMLKSMYLTWLFMTGISHPSVDTAGAYVNIKADSNYADLVPTPRKFETYIPVALMALTGAIQGYSQLMGLDDYFDPAMLAIVERHEDLIARENSAK